MPRKWPAATSLALVAGIASVILFAAAFFVWPNPDFVWNAAIAAALAALFLGSWALRKGRVARLAAIVAVTLGLLVIAYIALIVLTYGE